jgi:hypothetical protein
MTREIIESIDNSLKKREAGLRKTLSPDSHMARLMSIKMLMKAKKRREDAASEQKLKLDPLLNSQPSFFFSYKKAGNEKQDRANFSSYLSGELTLSDFIQIQNFERLYN